MVNRKPAHQFKMNIPDDLWQPLVTAAHQSRRSLSGEICEALQHHLDTKVPDASMARTVSGLESLFDPIRQAMQDMEARALRFEYIAATIRVNATRHGATNDQIEDFVAGRADFIGWIAEKVERPTPDPRVAALVEALTEITETPARRYQQKIARAALAAFKGDAQ